MCRPVPPFALAALAALALAPATSVADHIASFDSDITVLADGSLEVTETLRVVTTGSGSVKRGIIRVFPTLNKGPFESPSGLKKDVPFDVTSVHRNAQPEPFVVENVKAGKRVRIGQADVILPPGTHAYTLSYRTDLQLRFLATHDELYWNVTGNYWELPIDKASAAVALPQGVPVTSFEAYTGEAGAAGQAYTAEQLSESSVRFETTDPLTPGEGLTVVVTFPKGHIAEPSPLAGWLVLNGPVVAGGSILFATLIWHFLAWIRAGRDPAPGTIIPQFSPPPGFSPAACRYLVRTGFDNKCFSATVIDLAVKGKLRIEQDGKNDFTLRAPDAGHKTAAGVPEPDEEKVFSKLLGNRRSLKLEPSNHKSIGGARKALKEALAAKLERTHFVRNIGLWLPGLLATVVAVVVTMFGGREPMPGLFVVFWLTIWSVGVTFLLAAVWSAAKARIWAKAVMLGAFSLPFVFGWLAGGFALATVAGPTVLTIFVVGVVANGVFYHLIKAPTHAGRKVLDHIEGFREYLSVAEEDRLNALNPPQKTPDLFERFLPYALALDCDQQWSERFSTVLAAAAETPSPHQPAYHPTWFSGAGSASHLGRTGFATALGSAMAASLASSSQSPSTSSGSGGGGFSGGGGGGGGGGGW